MDICLIVFFFSHFFYIIVHSNRFGESIHWNDEPVKAMLKEDGYLKTIKVQKSKLQQVRGVVIGMFIECRFLL